MNSIPCCTHCGDEGGGLRSIFLYNVVMKERCSILFCIQRGDVGRGSVLFCILCGDEGGIPFYVVYIVVMKEVGSVQFFYTMW